MKKIVWIAVAVVLLTITIGSCVIAKPAEVWMGDFMLMRIRVDNSGMTAQQRAGIIQDRANNLTKCGGFDLSTIRVKKTGKDAAIFANKKLFATVTPADAKANEDTVRGLANKWAEKLRTVYPKVVPKAPADCVAPSAKKKMPVKLTK